MENETTSKLQQRFHELYLASLHAGLCTDKASFAELIGVARQTASSAFSGQRISAQLITRAEAELAGKLPDLTFSVVMENKDNAHDNVQKNFETLEQGVEGEDVRAIVHELVEAFNKERESHERIVLAMLDAFRSK